MGKKVLPGSTTTHSDVKAGKFTRAQLDAAMKKNALKVKGVGDNTEYHVGAANSPKKPLDDTEPTVKARTDLSKPIATRSGKKFENAI